MLITVTDKGMNPHEYARSCKCRGCVAVRKAKTRAALFAFPAAGLAGLIIGFSGGRTLGILTGVAAAIIAAGVFTSLNPSEEVLKADDD